MSVPALLDTKNIEEFCGCILDGMAVGAIAQKWGCARHDIYGWLHRHEGYTQRYLDAKRLAADYCDEQALLNLQLATNLLDLHKATQIAQHLRWRAKAYWQGYADKPEAEKPVETKIVIEGGLPD